MRTLIGWTVGAACATVIVAGLPAPHAPANEVKQDRREVAKDVQEVRQDRKDLQSARQQLRDAYKTSDPNAIKAARENYQKTRGDWRQDRRELHRDLTARRAK
jgi:hypothetical protein